MSVFPKFIIENNHLKGDCLIISNCTYHKQLAKNVEKIKGGGWFSYDIKEVTFTLYGESHDFGMAKIEDIKECISNGNVYTNKSLRNNISEKYKFKYKNAVGEIIDLN
jgi:hypothetical protein